MCRSGWESGREFANLSGNPNAYQMWSFIFHIISEIILMRTTTNHSIIKL